MKKKRQPSQNFWKKKSESLKVRLSEALETLDAIQRGAVDALVVHSADGNRIYTLENAEKPYRILVENMNEGAVTFVESGMIFYSNRRFAEMIKTPLDKVIGSSVYDWISKDVVDNFKQILELGKKLGKQEVFYLAASDNTFLKSLFSISPVEVNGNPGYCLVVADLTDQEKLDRVQREVEQAKRSEEHFRLIAETIPQLCWIARADGFIFWYNQRWYNYTGTKAKDMEGWGWKSLHDPRLLPSVLERWQNSISTGNSFEMEYPLRSAEGHFRWFLTRVMPFRDPENKIVNWFGTNTDIDDQKRAISDREELLKKIRTANEQLEQKILERTKDLIQSNKELEQFAYVASHDLQAPLRHITSYVQLLTDKFKTSFVLDAQTEKWTKYIIGGAQQMKTLITDLLTYSRVGRVDINVEKVAMNELFTEVLDSLQGLIQKSEAKIIYINLPEIFGVRSQIKQLFQNLIENAIKFKTPGLDPVVTVSFEEEDGRWKFRIADNGIGIDPKYFDKIFIMFQRLHSESKYSGTGIGLAICKKIIEFHGGKIGVDSMEGKGATFFFSLPKKPFMNSQQPD